MDKEEKLYEKEYGDVPFPANERLMYLLKKIHYKKQKTSVYDLMELYQSIKWKTQTFIICEVPKATPRPRTNYNTHVFYVKGAKTRKNRFKKFLINEDWEMVTTPCKFEVKTYFPIPSSMKKQEQILAEFGMVRPISKPDWDNLGKTYSDMIQGTVLYDDALIIDGRAQKFYSIKPRVEITITYMEIPDSDFNWRKILKQLKKKGENRHDT